MRGRYDREDVVPIVIMVVAVGIFLWIAFWLLSGQANAATEFDHSNCQYPTRTSNPPAGCDNSDPAVPECVSPKIIDEQACIDEYVRTHDQKDGSILNLPEQTGSAAAHELEKTSVSVNCTESK